MPKDTELNIYIFLQNKEITLKNEIKRYQVLLDFLADGTKTNRVHSEKSKKTDRLLPLKIPSAYHERGKAASKIAFALSKIGTATEEKIFVYINDLEPEADPIRLRQTISRKLQALRDQELLHSEYRAGQLHYRLLP